MKLTSLKQIARLLQADILTDAPITGFAVDSRLIKPGNVFFALEGAKVDGHHFLEEAAKAKACLLVVNKSYRGDHFGQPIIYVDDTLRALQELSKKILEERSSKVVAITGSVGKTTTKDFLTTILEQKYKVSKTQGNANSQIGLALTILNHTTGDEDVLVLEMGMNEPGQIAKLVEIAPPDIAILTHVSLTHAGNFESLKEIAYEKGEIFKHPKTKIGIINYDIENINELMAFGTCSKVSFSVVSHDTDFYFDGSNIQINLKESFKLDHALHPFFGKHHYQNLTAAIAAALALGLTFDEIKRAEKLLCLPEKRFEVVEIKDVLFVNDSYNASEISVKAALESLPEPKNGGKKIAVIGELMELGKYSDQCHLNVGIKALQHVDSMMLLGKGCLPIYDHWKENKKPVELFLTRQELVESLKMKINTGDVVLLKGSNSNQLWKILDEV